jgi:hypothetical protein
MERLWRARASTNYSKTGETEWGREIEGARGKFRAYRLRFGCHARELEEILDPSRTSKGILHPTVRAKSASPPLE